MYLFKKHENICSHKTVYTDVYSSTIHNRQNILKKNPDIHQLMNVTKMWFINTIVCYSAMQINEVLIHVTTWINFENIILSELN